MKVKVITIAKKVYILADSRKFDKVLMSFIGNWNREKDTLITDKDLPLDVK